MKMKQASEKFTKKLREHKILISNMIKTEDRELVIPVQMSAKELALAYSKCRCEKCDIVSDLQYHHLIQRNMKNYMYFWKYMSQRYYWANILILCRRCHAIVENRNPSNNKSETIRQEVIDRVKKKYEIKADNQT